MKQGNDKLSNVTIGIITALPLEYATVRVMLEKQDTISVPGTGAGRRYVISEIPSNQGGEHTVVLSLAGKGNNIAAARATLLLEHFENVKYLIMVGIAGGVPNPEKPKEHVRLGDIVVSDDRGIIQYDFDKEMVVEVIHQHPPRPPSAKLLEAVNLLMADAIMGVCPWLSFIQIGAQRLNASHPSEETDILVDSANPKIRINHPKDIERIKDQPRVFRGPVASANKLLNNPIKRDMLRDKFNVKAIEMEGSGVADATWNHEEGYLVVRGICDYCDSNKGDTWQKYAAIAAAGYVRALIQSMPCEGNEAGKSNEETLLHPVIPPILAPPDPHFRPTVNTGELVTDQINSFLYSSTREKILVLFGPPGSGKTTSALKCFYEAETSSETSNMFYIDFEDPENQKKLSSFRIGSNERRIIIDHLEAAWQPDQPGQFNKMIREIADLSRRAVRVVILIDHQSLDLYKMQYGMTLQQVLALTTGIDAIISKQLLPISIEDAKQFLTTTVLPIELFHDDEMRRPGVLALAYVAADDIIKKGNLMSDIDVKLLYYRHMLQQGRGKNDAIMLDFLTRCVARKTLGYLGAFTTVSELVSELSPEYSKEDIIKAIKEPMRIDNGRVSFTFSSIEKVAAAYSLISMLKQGEVSSPIKMPPHQELLPLMAQIAQSEGLTAEQIYKELSLLRGKNFYEIGYNSMIYASLLFAFENKPMLFDLSDLWLQGPEHSSSKTVPARMLSSVKDIWMSSLFNSADDLIKAILQLVEKDTKSCYSGCDAYWGVARLFARRIHLKQLISEKLLPFIDRLPAWKYEDVLNTLVTDVTTIFLDKLEQCLLPVMGEASEPNRMILADIWDGLNDGAWDTITGIQTQQDQFCLSNQVLNNVDFSRAHLQRAHFGESDLAGCRFAEASLHLADLRSAINVSMADYTGADWYNSILRPSDRYILSRSFLDDKDFLNWCSNPPWHNPYYTCNWPKPFEN